MCNAGMSMLANTMMKGHFMLNSHSIRKIALAALVALAPATSIAQTITLPGIQLPTPIPGNFVPVLPTPTPPGNIIPVPLPNPVPVPVPPVVVVPEIVIYPSCPAGFVQTERTTTRVACRVQTAPAQYAATLAAAQATSCQYPQWNVGPSVQYLGPPTQPWIEWACARN